MIRLSRRTLIQSAALAATVFPHGAAFGQTPRKGGTLTLASGTEPPTLVTFVNPSGTSLYLTGKVTEGLLTYDFDLNPLPQLAIAWTISHDGLIYTFKLRPNVSWHDGKPFTSADVAYSIQTIKEVHPRGRSTFSAVSEIRTPDPLTVELVLMRPVPYLLTALAASETPIVPKHLYEGTDPATNKNNLAPIGTGPFVFKEWVRGSHIIYERNPHYWDAPKPYIDRLIVRIITDQAAVATALETRSVDIGGGTPVPFGDLERLKGLPHLAFETRGNEYHNNSTTRIEFNLDNPYFAKKDVRQAVAHAIDRKVLLDTVWYGFGQIAPGPISPVQKAFFDPAVPILSYDLSRAEALLEQAGLPRGSDGLRFKVTHDVFDPVYGRVGQYLRQQLGKIGIGVELRNQEFSAYVRRVYTDRKYDFNSQGMSHLFDPTVGIQRFYWSKNFKPGVPFSNGSHYANPEVDRLLEAAAIEIDPSKRKALFSNFQRIIADEVPAIGLVAPAQITIANRRVINHTVTADGIMGNFADVFLSDPA